MIHSTYSSLNFSNIIYRACNFDHYSYPTKLTMAIRLLVLRTPLVAPFLPVSRGHHLITNRTRPHTILLKHHFSTSPGKGEFSHGVQEIPQDQYNQRAPEPKSIETTDMNQVLLEVVNGQRKRQDMQDEQYKLLLQDYTRLQVWSIPPIP